MLIHAGGTLDQRFADLTDRDRGDGCWWWLGTFSLSNDDVPYPMVCFENHERRAHIVSHEHFIGPVPAGMHVDHRCHNTMCVNPAHLRIATPSQNGQNRIQIQANNTSGARGVFWHKRQRKWNVTVILNQKRHNGGSFSDFEEAKNAARDLRNQLYTHNDADRRESA